MFLRDLTDEQKLVFYTFAREFVAVDGRLAEEEEALLSMFCSEMDIPEDTPPLGGDREELLAVFDTQRARIAVLLEFIALGYADGDFDVRERDLMQEMVASFGLTEEQLSVLEDWVERQIELMDEAADLMNGEWQEGA